MILEFKENKLVVTKEPTDKKYYGHKNTSGESQLLYAIKQEMKKLGMDVIKKRMHKDGHLVSEMQQYIRERKRQENGTLRAWWNGHWQINGLNEDFNEGCCILLEESI